MDTNAIAFLVLCLGTAWDSFKAMFAWLTANPLALAAAAAAGLLVANAGTLVRRFRSGG